MSHQPMGLDAPVAKEHDSDRSAACPDHPVAIPVAPFQADSEPDARAPDLLAGAVDRCCRNLAQKVWALGAVDELATASETLLAASLKRPRPAREIRQRSLLLPIRPRLPGRIRLRDASVFPSENREAASLQSRQSCLPVRNLLEDA